MMYGQGFAMGWMWFGGIVLVLILAALIILVIRASATGASSRGVSAPPVATGTALRIAEERLARGEITPDEFRQIAGALGEPK